MNEETPITVAEVSATQDASATALEAAADAVSTTETQAVEGVATPAAQRPAQQQSGFGMFVPMLLILAIFYFMMIKPQQRKEKERKQMIATLRAGAKVVFAGGITGTIVEATEKTFKVETSPGNTMEIVRDCVQAVVS